MPNDPILPVVDTLKLRLDTDPVSGEWICIFTEGRGFMEGGEFNSGDVAFGEDVEVLEKMASWLVRKEYFGDEGPAKEKLRELFPKLKMLFDEKQAGFSATDQRHYFDREKFIPSRLADEIMEEREFKTLKDTEETFYYDAGCYHENGEAIIKAQVAEKLGEELSKHRTNEVLHDIKSRTLTDRREFNRRATLICLKNGILNLETNKLERHNPSILFTTQIPIKYDKAAECPAIEKFVSEIVSKKDVKVVQELFGYCLLASYFIQKGFMFVGGGANGKSTLLALMKAFLGSENVASVSLHDLNTQRFARANLYGKHANLFADLPDKSLMYTGVFKMLVGGDVLTAEKKFKPLFSFVNHAKLIFSANKLPETTDESDAYYRRWVLINFPNTFEGDDADKKLLEKLKTELSGLLNWALEGLERLENNSNFSNTASTKDTRELYDRMSSPLKGFIMDRTERDSEATIPKSEFYSAYVEYCKEKNLPAKAENTIGKKLRQYAPYVDTERGGTASKRTRNWKGIRLRNDPPKDGLNQYAGRDVQDV